MTGWRAIGHRSRATACSARGGGTDRSSVTRASDHSRQEAFPSLRVPPVPRIRLRAQHSPKAAQGRVRTPCGHDLTDPCCRSPIVATGTDAGAFAVQHRCGPSGHLPAGSSPRLSPLTQTLTQAETRSWRACLHRIGPCMLPYLPGAGSFVRGDARPWNLAGRVGGKWPGTGRRVEGLRAEDGGHDRSGTCNRRSPRGPSEPRAEPCHVAALRS